MANDFMIDQVLGQILYDPKSHNQDNWVKEDDQCGTTRCVAGWAVHLSGEYNIEWRSHSPGMQSYPVAINKNTGMAEIWSEAGAKILGLDEDTACHLFFECNDEQAVELLKELKNN